MAQNKNFMLDGYWKNSFQNSLEINQHVQLSIPNKAHNLNEIQQR